MTTFQIIALYTALNLIFLVILTWRVIQVRLGKRISLGHGEDTALLTKIRTHSNFVENAPFALIGLFVLAVMNAPVIALHVFGAGFLIGRLLHAHGMTGKHAAAKTRPAGMLMTLLVHLGQALTLLYLVFTFSVV